MTHFFCWHEHVSLVSFCLNNIAYFIEIFVLCKFQVIWIIQTEVFYAMLNFQDIGKFKQIVPKNPPPRNRIEPFPIEILVCTRYIINPAIFWGVFLLLFKYLITFCTEDYARKLREKMIKTQFGLIFLKSSCTRNTK